MVAVAPAPTQTKTISLSKIPGQEAFVFDRRRYSVWTGGRGSAKTTSGVFKLIVYLQQNEGARVTVIGPTLGQLRDATMEAFYRWIPPEWILHRSRDKSDYHCDLLLPGHTQPSLVCFRSSYNPETFRGPEIAAVWADEHADCDPTALKILDACQRQQRADGSFYPFQTWLTGTARGQNHIWQRFLRSPDSKLVGVYFSESYSNPFLPPGYTDTLDREYGIGTPWHDQEVLGKVVEFQGLVYPSFSQEIHVKPAPETFKRVIGAVDFGLSEASCVYLVGETTAGRRWFFKEFYQKHAKSGQMMGTMARWRQEIGTQMHFCDPRFPEEIATLNANGIPACKANAAMEVGVRMVNQLLAVDATGEPGLYISPECPNLVREMLMYCHDDSGYGDDVSFYDSIKKHQSDHACDCLRYGILGAMGRQAKSNIVALRF